MPTSSSQRLTKSRGVALAFLVGTISTLSAFWMMSTHKIPWQFNWVLMPGGIVAVLLGFLTRYSDPWYGLTFIAGNVVFYACVAFAFIKIVPFLGRVLLTRENRPH